MRKALADMGHQKPPTLVATDNTAANSTLNGTGKKIITRAIDIRFHWVRDRIRQNNFHIFWGEEKKNLADYVPKHHPIWNHRTTRPRYVKQQKKDKENSRDRRTGTCRWCAGTTNPGGIRRPDIPLKVTRNPIPRNPDNPIKGI